MMLVAPALVGMRQKTRWHPSAVDASIRAGLVLARESPHHTVPVFHAGEVVGLVRGRLDRRTAWWKPLTSQEFSGFNNFDTLNNAVKNGQVTHAWFRYASYGVQHNWFDAWAIGGNPPAGTMNGTTLTCTPFDNTTVGGIWHGYQTPSGSQNSYVVAVELAATGRGSMMAVLYDRVAAYDNCTVTANTLQSMTNTSTPARYVSAGQDGMMVAFVAKVAMGSTASNLTGLDFTDQSGNAGTAFSAGYTLNFHNSAAANTVCVPWDNTNNISVSPFVPLAGNVTGVRLVKDYTTSVANTGNFSVVLMKPLGFYSVCSSTTGSNGAVQRRDLAKATYALEKVFSTACLSLLTQCQNAQSPQGKIMIASN